MSTRKDTAIVIVAFIMVVLSTAFCYGRVTSKKTIVVKDKAQIKIIINNVKPGAAK